MKHTLGPWSVVIPKSKQVRMYVARPPEKGKAAPIVDVGGYGDTLEQDEANARLIAAAPELLEALEQILSELPDKGVITQLTLRDAVNAIAKATGGAE